MVNNRVDLVTLKAIMGAVNSLLIEVNGFSLHEVPSGIAGEEAQMGLASTWLGFRIFRPFEAPKKSLVTNET